ncbi:MAG: DMT family transporter, partial [Bdellovibrionales bacterium]|nr:DMT family transporter [Bdellovibrionales bacterium]
LEALHFRAIGAMVSFIIFVPFVKIRFVESFKKLSIKERLVAVLSSFFGTFLSLVFYMHAIRLGKLATVTSIVLTDPMMSTFFECLWLRVWPTRYLWIAIGCFLCAMFCLMYPQFS